MKEFTKQELQIINASLLNFIIDNKSFSEQSIILRDKIRHMINDCHNGNEPDSWKIADMESKVRG